MSQQTIVVEWTNPVTRVTRTVEFASVEDARRYISGRDWKYGKFTGFKPATIVGSPQR